MSDTKQMLAGFGLGGVVLAIAGYLAYTQFYTDMAVASGYDYNQTPAGMVGGPGSAVKEERAPADESGSEAAEAGSDTAVTTDATDSVAAQGSSIEVTVNGVANSNGKVYIMVFDNAQAFNNYDVESVAGFAEVKARKGSVSATITDLPDAPIAISVFHDENGNENFDMAGGYPSEGYGTSRSDSPYDDLKFNDASIPVGDASVTMHYMR